MHRCAAVGDAAARAVDRRLRCLPRSAWVARCACRRPGRRGRCCGWAGCWPPAGLAAAASGEGVGSPPGLSSSRSAGRGDGRAAGRDRVGRLPALRLRSCSRRNRRTAGCRPRPRSGRCRCSCSCNCSICPLLLVTGCRRRDRDRACRRAARARCGAAALRRPARGGGRLVLGDGLAVSLHPRCRARLDGRSGPRLRAGLAGRHGRSTASASTRRRWMRTGPTSNRTSRLPSWSLQRPRPTVRRTGIRSAAEPRFDERGVFLGYWGVGRDVTATSRPNRPACHRGAVPRTVRALAFAAGAAPRRPRARRQCTALRRCSAFAGRRDADRPQPARVLRRGRRLAPVRQRAARALNERCRWARRCRRTSSCCALRTGAA